mmetsp:Transcript_62394/g.185642  ORF Transcript_62394/g.185642 Transcript_62394/m.185642 type:complete len:435 (+) Transcript_62394:135-1439(+)
MHHTRRPQSDADSHAGMHSLSHMRAMLSQERLPSGYWHAVRDRNRPTSRWARRLRCDMGSPHAASLLLLCGGERGLLPVEAERHAGNRDDAEDGLRDEHGLEVAALGRLGRPAVPEEAHRKAARVEEIGEERRGRLAADLERELAGRQVEGQRVRHAPQEEQRHREWADVKRQRGAVGEQCRHDRTDDEEHGHEQSLLGGRHLLVEHVADDEEAEDGAAAPQPGEARRVAVAVAKVGVQQRRAEVHKELRVREDEDLREEHQPKVERAHVLPRRLGGRRGRRGGSRLAAARCRAGRGGGLGGRPQGGADEAEQELHGHDRHERVAPRVARLQQCAKEHRAERGTEAGGGGDARELRGPLLLGEGHADHLARRTPRHRVREAVDPPADGEDVGVGGQDHGGTREQVAGEYSDQHEPPAQLVGDRGTEKLASEAHG